MKVAVADPQYSSRNVRDKISSLGVRAVIPYPANQLKGKRGVLRVDRFFRVHGSSDEKRLYRCRSSVERVNSRLKDPLGLENHRVRGLKRLRFHALLCLIVMLLNAVASVRLGRREEARSLSFLAE